jgi:2',3'-cyclic-nucleotide 2'-phosphodiesterase (5'-nucleotidase family)
VNYSKQTVKGTLTTLDSTFVQDSMALAMIRPYKSTIDIEMNEIISFAEIDITKNQPEGLLNNFISDLLLNMCNKYYIDNNMKYDVAIFNNGGLRAGISKGLVTVGDVYKVMPFENEAVVITLDSDHFKEMVNFIITSGGIPFSGMRIVSRHQKLESLIVGGKPFEENQNYTVITSDYLAYGGDRMSFFVNPVEIMPLSVLVRDLIIDYMREQNKLGISLHPQLDGRIVYE